MHIRFNNKRSVFNLGAMVLGSRVVVKDLGVMIQDNLKVEAQCNKDAGDDQKEFRMQEQRGGGTTI